MWNKNRSQITWAPICILLVATLARLFFILQLPDRVLWSDEQKNIQIAANVASGNGFTLKGKPTAIIPLAYPLFLAGLRLLGCSTLLQIRLVQLAISLLTIAFAGSIAAQWFGKRIAILTMAIYAVYPYFVYLPGTVLATTLFCFLVVLGTWFNIRALTSNDIKYIAAAGLVWGVAALTVSTAVILVFAVILWHWRNSQCRRQRYLHLALLGIIFLAVISPWMIRNYVRMGMVNLASNGGYNFWLGNNPDAIVDNPSSLPTPDSLQQRLIQAGEEAKQDAIFTREALRYIQAQPLAFVARTLLKALYFWRLDPSPVTHSYVTTSPMVRLLGWLAFTPLLILAAWGFHRAHGVPRKVIGLWILMAIGFTLFHALMIVKVRFRLPLDQFVIIVAALGADDLWQRMRQKSTMVKA